MTMNEEPAASRADASRADASRGDASRVDTARADTSRVILTLDHVRKDLGASKETMRTIIPDLSIAIDRGEFVAITGPSGSGKSTILYLMGALDRPTSGSVRVDGDEVSSMPEEKLARIRNAKIGFIYQFHFLLPEFTALENVTMPMLVAGTPPKEARDRGTELLRRMGLEQKTKSRPKQLSGGEQQRVAVARAMANNPLLLLCDEPTGALDSQSSAQVFDLMTELNAAGQTIIYVTHDNALADRAGRRIRIVDGRIEEKSEV